MAVCIYNTVKVFFFVKQKFGRLPFTSETVKLSLVLVVLLISFYIWDFSFHPLGQYYFEVGIYLGYLSHIDFNTESFR